MYEDVFCFMYILNECRGLRSKVLKAEEFVLKKYWNRNRYVDQSCRLVRESNSLC